MTLWEKLPVFVTAPGWRRRQPVPAGAMRLRRETNLERQAELLGGMGIPPVRIQAVMSQR